MSNTPRKKRARLGDPICVEFGNLRVMGIISHSGMFGNVRLIKISNEELFELSREEVDKLEKERNKDKQKGRF